MFSVIIYGFDLENTFYVTSMYKVFGLLEDTGLSEGEKTLIHREVLQNLRRKAPASSRNQDFLQGASCPSMQPVIVLPL